MKKLLLATTLCAALGAAQAVPTLSWDDASGTGNASFVTYGYGVEIPVINGFSGFSVSSLNTALGGAYFLGSDPIDGYIGGSLKLSELPAYLDFTYLGKEAAHKNKFTFRNDSSIIGDFNNRLSSIGANFDANIDQDKHLNLTFKDLTSSFEAKSGFRSETFDKNPNNRSFGFVDTSFLGESCTAFCDDYDFLILFNDAGWDKDYNDMVVGVRVAAPVPEPETYALMLAGLGVVGFMARRRRQV